MKFNGNVMKKLVLWGSSNTSHFKHSFLIIIIEGNNMQYKVFRQNSIAPSYQAIIL